MTDRQKLIITAAYNVARAAREAEAAADIYKDQVTGKGKEYDTVDEAESELRAAVDDLQVFVHDFNKAVR